MSKAPAFQLYASDLLTDVMDWTDEQVGAHLRLLCWSWVNRRGIPRDFDRMCRIAPSAKKAWPVIGDKWKEGPDDTWVNGKLEQTRTDSDAFRAKQKAKSDLAVAARSHHLDKPTGSPTGLPVGNPLEDEEEDTTLKRKERATPFENWWKLYGKGSRKLSAEVWAKMPEADRLVCIAKTPAYIASKPDPIYRKDGERFLKHRTWEDPIVVPGQAPAAPPATGWATTKHLKPQRA